MLPLIMQKIPSFYTYMVCLAHPALETSVRRLECLQRPGQKKSNIVRQRMSK